LLVIVIGRAIVVAVKMAFRTHVFELTFFLNAFDSGLRIIVPVCTQCVSGYWRMGASIIC